jgi:4-hydroxybenzoate polyprenyltransferase
VRNASLVAAFLAIVFAWVIGPLAALTMLPMLIVGWAYNLGLKATWASPLPYALGFGMLPVFVSLASPDAEFPDVWFIAMAALLGVSAHFANALPDIFDDRETGVRALPHLLGQRASSAAIAITGIAASIITVRQATNVGPIITWFGFALAVAAVTVSSLLSLKPKPPRIVFPLLVVASLMNVLLLMLGLLS